MTKQPIYMQIVDNEQSFQHPKFYGKTGIKSLIQTDKTRKQYKYRHTKLLTFRLLAKEIK